MKIKVWINNKGISEERYVSHLVLYVVNDCWLASVMVKESSRSGGIGSVSSDDSFHPELRSKSIGSYHAINVRLGTYSRQ